MTRGLCASASSSGMSILAPQSSPGNNLKSSPPSSTNSAQVATQASREAIAVALWLNEEYDVIAGDNERKAIFSAQLAEDLATALQTSSRRIIVVPLQTST